MITLDIRGLPEIERMLRNLADKQMPFALSSALNSTAFAVQKFEKQRIPTVFDRPTPLIQGAFRVEKATKQELTAKVYVDRCLHFLEQPPKLSSDGTWDGVWHMTEK